MDSVWIRTVCSQNDLQLSNGQLQQLEKYSLELLEWNKKINLISRRDEENFWTRHILHCLSLIFKLEIPQGANLLDLGTGGGLPGIVLKIARPDLFLTLLDSTQKKINVVQELIGSLGLTGIQAVWGRAEDLGKNPEHTRRYDVVVARAVAPLKDLARWSHPFLKRNGMEGGVHRGDGRESRKMGLNTPALVALKGGNLDDEISQLRKQREIGPVTTIELTLKGSAQLDDRDKKIVVVEYVKTIR